MSPLPPLQKWWSFFPKSQLALFIQGLLESGLLWVAHVAPFHLCVVLGACARSCWQGDLQGDCRVGREDSGTWGWQTVLLAWEFLEFYTHRYGKSSPSLHCAITLSAWRSCLGDKEWSTQRDPAPWKTRHCLQQMASSVGSKLTTWTTTTTEP